MNLRKRLEAIKELTPASGYNLVGVDDYGDYEDHGLYFIAHYDDEDEANTAKVARENARPGQTYYVYGPAEPAAT